MLPKRVFLATLFSWCFLLFFMGQALAGTPAYLGYRLHPGDTLWLLAQRYGTTVGELQHLNGVGPQLSAGQFLFVPVVQEGGALVYRVQPGDTLYLIGQRHGREAAAIKEASGLADDWLYPGQRLLVPIAAAGYQPYRVSAGDTLFLLARRFGTSVERLQQDNSLASPLLLEGQLLQVPRARPAPGDRSTDSERVILYRVVAGDTLSGLALRFRTSVAAIERTNRLHSLTLMPGQPLYIPAGSSEPVAVEGPRGEQRPGYGELLEWEWARWVYNVGCEASIIDFYTGNRFRVRHLGGSNHADSEPLTPADTAVMKQLFGGRWSWSKRPVLLEVEGRLLAASIAGMPHGVESIFDNDFGGHFDVYFLNSRSHNTNSLDPQHQQNVLIAAGQH